MVILTVICFDSCLQMSNWLIMEIVSLENIDERVALYARLVDVMSVSIHAQCSAISCIHVHVPFPIGSSTV